MSGGPMRPIPIVSEYARLVGSDRDLPIVVREFKPSRGWGRSAWRKHLSGSYARKLRAEGVTHVALDINSRQPEFSIEELLRSVGRRSRVRRTR